MCYRDGEGKKKGEKRKRKEKPKKKQTAKTKKRRTHTSSSSDSEGESSDKPEKDKSSDKKKTKKTKKKRKPASSESSSSGDSSQSSDSSSTGEEEEAKKEKAKKKKKALLDTKWTLLEQSWERDQRPPALRKKKGIKNLSLDELLRLKKEVMGEEERKNLGEEVFRKDGKPKKIRFKASTDNSTTKLHPARGFRQPLVHPKEFYSTVPKKRDVVIRNFPMDHYGVAGQVSETVIGRLHNRTVVQTFDSFVKISVKTGKGGSGQGKYADFQQLQEGVNNYTIMLHALWPQDYTGVVMWKVLIEANWGEYATNDEKKRSELVIDFFNAVLRDNCGRAVHDEYPLVYEQVRVFLVNSFTD